MSSGTKTAAKIVSVNMIRLIQFLDSDLFPIFLWVWVVHFEKEKKEIHIGKYAAHWSCGTL